MVVAILYEWMDEWMDGLLCILRCQKVASAQRLCENQTPYREQKLFTKTDDASRHVGFPLTAAMTLPFSVVDSFHKQSINEISKTAMKNSYHFLAHP